MQGLIDLAMSVIALRDRNADFLDQSFVVQLGYFHLYFQFLQFCLKCIELRILKSQEGRTFGKISIPVMLSVWEGERCLFEEPKYQQLKMYSV